MAIEVVLKKWGNSIGGVFPKDFVRKNKLSVDDTIFVEVVRKTNLTKLFGSLPRKKSGQQFKDMVRKGWK
ncbi:hypothetical protein KY366_00120 [Candidatus Woesearchaeota archaeon]|nr:hypothetical protein [Candidatus Woesearchaeota archaeon]